MTQAAARPAVDPSRPSRTSPSSSCRQKAQALPERINRFRLALGRHCRRQAAGIIDLMTIAGGGAGNRCCWWASGTAKSDLVIKFKDRWASWGADYFEYLLTRFTEPPRCWGHRHQRLRSGPTFAGNEASCRRRGWCSSTRSSRPARDLERAADRHQRAQVLPGRRAVPVRLKILFAATNEIPEHSELGALKTRTAKGRLPLGARDALHRAARFRPRVADQQDLNQKPWAEGLANPRGLCSRRTGT